MSARPIAAPFPSRPGIYWLKIAKAVWKDWKFTWDDPRYEWIIGRVEDDVRDWFSIIGSDDIIHWEDRTRIVVEVGPEIIPPSQRCPACEGRGYFIGFGLTGYESAIEGVAKCNKCVDGKIPAR